MDGLTIHSPPVRVATFVYAIAWTGNLRLSAAYWIPITVLQDMARRTQHTILIGERLRRYPAIQLLGKGRQLLWGIIYRLIRRLLAVKNILLIELLRYRGKLDFIKVRLTAGRSLDLEAF